MIRTLKAVLLTISLLLIGVPAAWAQLDSSTWGKWDNTAWKLNESKSRFECALCTEDDKKYMHGYHATLKTMDKWVRPELEAISRWMSSMGYLQAKLPAIPGPFYVYSPRNRSEAAVQILGSRLGSYHPDDGIQLSYDAFIGKIGQKRTYDEAAQRDNSVTLAHEVYHGVQAALGTMQDEKAESTWYSEGMPEAVGRAWEAKRHGSAHFSRSDYSQPLHEPDDVYSRAHFFYRLGEDLRASPPVEYFKELDRPTANDGHQGIVWIDTYLRGVHKPLAEYFPDFIAKHAITARYFSEADEARSAKKQYSVVTEVAPGAAESVHLDDNARHVEPVAAHYAEVSPVFNGDWSPINDADRIYATILSIHDPERPDDARLIVDRALIPQGERYIDLVYASTGNYDPPMRARVTNVAQDPKSSAGQSFRLRLETANVQIRPPVCMSPGQNVPIEIDGPLSDAEKQQLFAQGPSRIKASAGKIEPDLSFTAPKSKQTVTLTVTVPTLNEGTRRIELAPVKVQDSDGCMIRVTINDAIVLTYTPDGNYVEFKPPKHATAMYIQPYDFAMYDQKDQEWMPLPPMMKAMIMSTMQSAIAEGIASTPPEFRGRIEMHNFPLVFSDVFSWKNMYKSPDPKGGKLKQRPASCPNGKSGCTSVDVRSGSKALKTIFNKDGSPALVELRGATFLFDYGHFDIRRPPGW